MIKLKVKTKENKKVAEKEYDCCVLCGCQTSYLKDTPVSERYGYIEGGGQLCLNCFKNL